MCGIAGIWNNKISSDEIYFGLHSMINVIQHRGPDDGDVWFDKTTRLGFAHRRLAIIDLSITGHQPMQSSCKNFIIVFNGEIYNHIQIRSKLFYVDQNIKWRGSSDTETLLESIRLIGLEETLKLASGMFALALYDRQSESLSLARDRFGEKPLYFGYNNGSFVFASELKSIKAVPGLDLHVSLKSVQLQSQFAYVPDPFSIYEGISKLEPGTILKLSILDLKNNNPGKSQKYWSADESAFLGLNNKIRFNSDNEAISELDRLLKISVNEQMVSDVPVGALLSGGIDSSLIVALMQLQSTKPIKTFTIGFDEMGYNEAVHAKAVAKHLGTDHTELYVTAKDSISIVDRLSSIYDEPFADPSQIPSILVSQLAKSKVTVCLSGDGGDELFAGYSRYLFTKTMWSKISSLPKPIRSMLIKIIHSLSPKKWESVYNSFVFNSGNKLIGNKLYKTARALRAHNGKDLYFNMVTHSDSRNLLLTNFNIEDVYSKWFNGGSTIDQMMLFDTISYLPGDILTKMDRAAMSVSLETRIPFLNHNLYEFAWKLDEKYKLRNGVGKWITRNTLYNYVPERLVNRPKMGFSVPVGDWIRGPLKDWAEDLLDDYKLGEQGYYNKHLVKQLWDEHKNGRQNWDYQLWNILIFQQWLKSNKY